MTGRDDLPRRRCGRGYDHEPHAWLRLRALALGLQACWCDGRAVPRHRGVPDQRKGD